MLVLYEASLQSGQNLFHNPKAWTLGIYTIHISKWTLDFEAQKASVNQDHGLNSDNALS